MSEQVFPDWQAGLRLLRNEGELEPAAWLRWTERAHQFAFGDQQKPKVKHINSKQTRGANKDKPQL